MDSLPKTASNKLCLLVTLMYGFIGDVCIFWGQRTVLFVV